jgi:hypothetical protein
MEIPHFKIKTVSIKGFDVKPEPESILSAPLVLVGWDVRYTT